MLRTPTKSPRPFNSISKKQKYEILIDDMEPRKQLFEETDSSDEEMDTCGYDDITIDGTSASQGFSSRKEVMTTTSSWDATPRNTGETFQSAFDIGLE